MPSGTEQRKATATGSARQPDLRRYYAHQLPAITGPDWEAQVICLTAGRAYRVDNVTEQVTWDDSQNVLTGDIQLRRPDPLDPRSVPGGRGDRIRLRVRWGDSFYQLWEMRMEEPTPSVESGTIDAQLIDDLDPARRTERDWDFRARGAHPNGWRPDQIAVHAGKVCGIRLGSIAKGTVRLRHFKHRSMDPVRLITLAYEAERKHSGRRFVIRFRDGYLEVVPYRRNDVAWVIDGGATSFQPQLTGSAKPVTVITGKARVGKGKAARHIEHTEYDRDVVRRFGYTHRTRDYGRVHDAAQLRARVRRDLADSIRIKRTAQVTMPFLPFIRRGDACYVDFPKEGFAGRKAIMFVTSAQHTLSSATPNTQLSLEEHDPFFAYQREQEAAAREAARRARARRRMAAHV